MSKRIILVGGGTMGLSIGRLFAAHGWAVHAVDPSPVARDAFANTVSGATTSATLAHAGNADIALECVPEKLDLKRKMMAELEDHLPASAAILSNTSGLALKDLTTLMKQPERAMIAHFFNPADIIPAVEVVPAPDAPEGLCDGVMDILRTLGKRPVALKNAPLGFIANRVQHAIMRECLHLVDEGVATAAEIDDIVQWSIGVRMAISGPFRQRDLNGLGTHLNIANYLYPDLCDTHTPSPTLVDMVAHGHLGRNAGKGFYDWPETDDTSDDASLARVIAAAAENRKEPRR